MHSGFSSWAQSLSREIPITGVIKNARGFHVTQHNRNLDRHEAGVDSVGQSGEIRTFTRADDSHPK